MIALTTFLAIGTLVGLILGLTGSGGSILAMPLLTLLMGIDPHEALIIAVTLVCFSAFIGVTRKKTINNIHLKSGVYVALGGALTTPFGAKASFLISAHTLMSLFGCLMLVIGFFMFQRGRITRLAEAGGGSFTYNDELPTTQASGLSLLGMGAGFLSGLFGIGGGIFMVPALNFFGGLPIKKAVATSLFVTTLYTSISCLTHLLSHSVPPPLTLLPLFAGGYLGMSGGLFLQHRLPPYLFQYGLAMMLLLFGALLLIREYSGAL